MKSLTSLYASGTGIKQFPRSVEMLRNLKGLTGGGQKLEAKRSIFGRGVHRIQYSLPTFLSILKLTYCNLTEADIPTNIGSLSSLKYLDLSGNSFYCLPFDLSKLRLLEELCLNDCENLQTLPSVSNLENLRYIELENCQKLVKITELDNLPSIERFNMINCSSLQNPFNEGFFNASARVFQSREHEDQLDIEIFLECKEIPEWCRNQVTTSSMCLTMPTHNNEEYNFLGMVLWFVTDSLDATPYPRFSISIAHKETVIVPWKYCLHKAFDGPSDIAYIRLLMALNERFDGEMIKGGETIEAWSEEVTVKKIGIHLLYLDQHGNVISLPGDVIQ